MREFYVAQKAKQAAIKEQLEAVVGEQLVAIQNSKSKKNKEKNKEAKKKLKFHQDHNTFDTLAAILFRLHNARKIVTYRTLSLLKIQEQRDSRRRDKEDYSRKMKTSQQELEAKTELLKEEIDKICELLQLTQDKKK